MPRLALALLGRFQAALDGLPAEGLNSDRLRALLAYLAIEGGREHPREQLAALLWPERSDREALSALRYALSNLHGALGDRRIACPLLIVTRTSVQFNAASDHWLDMAEFQDLSSRSDAPDLERAVSLYRGPFLDGISVRDSPAFEDWMLLKGEGTRRSVLSVLGHLTSLQMARGEYAAAAHWARRQIELEPYREQAHRQLMVALTMSGERAAALAHYEGSRRLLAQELGCEPEDETQALYAQIRGGILPQPQDSIAILAVSPVQAPPGAGARPPSRFVAREQELACLDALLDQALASHGGVALITGEPGGGKTALLDEFARKASQAHSDLIVLRGRCNAHAGTGDPFLPFREMLQTLAGDLEGRRAGGTLSAEQARRVWEALPAVYVALLEHGPGLIDSFVPGEALLRRMEGFPRPPGAGRWKARLRKTMSRAREGAAPALPSSLGAPAPQADLFAQVTQVLHAVSLRRPLFLVIDDLQWTDGGTAALLFHLGRRLVGSRILLACAYRPQAPDGEEGDHSVESGVWAVIHELHREWGDVLLDLDQADGRAFVEAYVDGEPNRLGVAFRQALYDHTGGNPLFTVELLRSFEREGALVRDEAGRWIEAVTLDWERWPPQVEAVIARSLAALQDEDRALLQAASVQGEQFAVEVAAQVLGWTEEAVVRRLTGPLRTRHRLVHAVSLDHLVSSGQRLSHYRFRHSLVHRSAYRSLDAVERARLHEATGRALEAIYAAEGERPLTLAPELARHFEMAGLPLAAARHRLEAGQRAVRLAAYSEALAHLERGLALLEGVATTRERRSLELALYLAMVNPAVLQQGFQSPRLMRALERLSELTQSAELQGTPQQLTALVVLAHGITWSTDPKCGRRVGEQLLGLAQESDVQSCALAHWVIGHSHWLEGQLVAACEHLGQALALYDPEAVRPLIPLLGGDPNVMGLAVLGCTLWLLGYPDQGRASLQQALAQAHAIEQRSSVAFAHLLAGLVYLILGRDVAAAQDHATTLRGMGDTGPFVGAWAVFLAGQAQEGQAVPVVQTMGTGAGNTIQSLVQARLCASAGQAELGLKAMDRTMAWIEQTGMRIMEAEVWRMRGELLLTADRPGRSRVDKADSYFRRALGIAGEQQARWLELRAAVSLARLWHTLSLHTGQSDRLRSHNQRGEARELLYSLCSWFTEGFDAVDLVEARALLEKMQ